MGGPNIAEAAASSPRRSATASPASVTTPAATSSPLAADPQPEDNGEDEAYEESLHRDEVESTASLTDSIRDFRNLHGRTFGNSKSTEYWAPNDNQQADGLDITHHYLLMYWDNKLFQAPIGDNPQRVLDVGTGTGSWAIDFADQFPSAQVIGTDISPIQPPWVPPNCEFQLDDAQLDWTWPKDYFDYIHMRDLYGGISDWQALYRSAFEHLAPGGWFEDQEFDIRCHSEVVSPDDEDHIINKWNAVFQEAGEKLGKTFKIAIGSRMRDHMDEAGFVDITEHKFRLPINPWCRDPKLKRVAAFVQLFINESIEGFALFLLTQIMGWKHEEVRVFCAQMRAAVADKAIRPYYEVTLVYGQKPKGVTSA